MQNLPGGAPAGANHPLFGKFDLDPGKWRPLFYPTYIDVPVAAGEIGRNSVTINNQPYIWSRITTKIVGNTAVPETSGLYNDGQWSIAFKDEQSNYQKDFFPADLAFGSQGSTNNSGFIIPLPYPIPFAGNKTITFEIRNDVLRVPAGAPTPTTYKICVLMAGVANWGDLLPPRTR